MISQATPTVREELSGVKWTGNVKPVSAATEKAVLDACRDRQREPQKTDPDRYMRQFERSGRANKLPRIDKAEIVGMSNRVLRILCRIAEGVGDKEATAPEAVRKEVVGHILRILHTKKAYLRSLHDKSTANIRRLMLIVAAGVQ